jgi:peptide deformylase
MIRTVIELSKDEFFNKENPLRQVSQTVENFDEDFQKEVQDLIDTFENIGIAVGLAAPQIGIFKRLAIINPKKNEGDKNHLIMVNPEIISISGSKNTYKETCLSLPDYKGPVVRRTKLKLKYFDRYGTENHIEAKDFLVRVILHEYDHLDGILYVDRVEDINLIELLEKNDSKD